MIARNSGQDPAAPPGRHILPKVSWARTDLNRRSTGYEPDALGRTKLRAHGAERRGAAERSLGRRGRTPIPFEPLTFRLTADRSTAELRRHRGVRAGIALIAFPARGGRRSVGRSPFLQMVDPPAHLVERPVEGRPEFAGRIRDDRSVGARLDDPLPLEEVERVADLVDRQMERLAEADDPFRGPARQLLEDVDVPREELELLRDPRASPRPPPPAFPSARVGPAPSRSPSTVAETARLTSTFSEAPMVHGRAFTGPSTRCPGETSCRPMVGRGPYRFSGLGYGPAGVWQWSGLNPARERRRRTH
jgi:hypothetical protein